MNPATVFALAPDSLRFDSAARGYRQIEDWLRSPALNLAAVGEADSAGVALLLALQRHARQHQKTLTLLNPPPQLLGLLRFFGVAELLGFTAQP